MIHRRAFSRLLAATGLAATGLAATRAAAQGAKVDVSIKQATSRFDPDPLTVKRGDIVTWTNPGFVTHTVTCDPAVSKTCVLPAGAAAFSSPDLEEDATFTHTFTVAGTYKYVCKYHEAMGMIGTVVVS
jgi:plastocyanin